MRVKTQLNGSNLTIGNGVGYTAPIMNGVVPPMTPVGSGVTSSGLPRVNLQNTGVNIFDGVNQIVEPVRVGGGVFDANKVYEALMTLINACPNTPEVIVFASKLKELGDTQQFNSIDSRALDKVISAIMSNILEELSDRNINMYANLMETISKRAVNDITVDSVSKWIGNGNGSTGIGRGYSLVGQAVNAFRTYMADNGLRSFDNISKFKKHFNNFVSKKPEYKDVLVSEAWSTYQGGVR